jgi:hypothetical protein
VEDLPLAELSTSALECRYDDFGFCGVPDEIAGGPMDDFIPSWLRRLLDDPAYRRKMELADNPRIQLLKNPAD